MELFQVCTEEMSHTQGLENFKSYELVTGVFYNGITSDSYREIVSNRIERERYKRVCVP
jgi:hypothetical protein